MLTFLFINQTLWCDHTLESSRRDDFNEDHIIEFGWEMRKLSWKQFCSLFIICSLANCSEPNQAYGSVQVGFNIDSVSFNTLCKQNECFFLFFSQFQQFQNLFQSKFCWYTIWVSNNLDLIRAQDKVHIFISKMPIS